VVWGGHVIIENTEAPAMRTATTAGGYTSRARLFLGKQCLLIGMRESHWHLVRWTDDTIRFDYENSPGGQSFKNPAMIAAWGAPMDQARADNAGVHPDYDTKRFQATVTRDGRCFALDRLGQVSVFDMSGTLLCMFMAFRTRIAAWLPDGSRCGSEALGQGPETPGAREKLAMVLNP
jgi:hypothetical protein